MVVLNEAPDRQAQVATNVELLLQSNQSHCSELDNDRHYYLVDSPVFLTAVNENKTDSVVPTMITSITPLKSSLTNLVERLFS